MKFTLIIKQHKMMLLEALHFLWPFLKSAKNSVFSENTINIESLIVVRLLSPRWKAIIQLQLKNEASLAHHADFLLMSALFEQKSQERHVVLYDVIKTNFTKISETVYLMDSVVWSKDEVSSGPQMLIMTIWVFSSLILWDYYRKFSSTPDKTLITFPLIMMANSKSHKS